MMYHPSYQQKSEISSSKSLLLAALEKCDLKIIPATRRLRSPSSSSSSSSSSSQSLDLNKRKVERSKLAYIKIGTDEICIETTAAAILISAFKWLRKQKSFRTKSINLTSPIKFKKRDKLRNTSSSSSSLSFLSLPIALPNYCKSLLCSSWISSGVQIEKLQR